MHVVHELVTHAAHVAALTNLIEKVGSYAGFGAVIGLAVLAALYFSQARDVKRLRDWAGRAPERASEVESGGRTPQAAAVRTGQPASGSVSPAEPISQPVLPGVQPARPAAPVPAGVQAGAAPATASAAAGARGAKDATPAPAVAAASAGAAPATAAQGAATPAGAAAAAGPSSASAAAQPVGSAAGTATAPKPAPATPGAGHGPGGTASGAAGSPAAPARPAVPARGAPPASPLRGNAGGGAKVLPPRPAPRPRTVIPGGSGNTAIIPPPKPAPDRRWTAPRYLALIVAGVLLLGLGGTAAVVALTGNDKKSPSKAGSPGVTVPLPAQKGKSTSKRRRAAAPAIDPATVTVGVLNGTQVTGLAGRIAQKVSGAGFRLGNVATATKQQRAESVVLYQPGSSRQARAVARKLGISQIEPADAQSAGLAGAATVIVVVGADKSGA